MEAEEGLSKMMEWEHQWERQWGRFPDQWHHPSKPTALKLPCSEDPSGDRPGMDSGNPSAVPVRDSLKSHIAKPDPFKERRDFHKFIQSTFLYTTANPREFPSDDSKIMFYLSYMKEGLPGQFAENVVQKMMEWEMLGLRQNLRTS
jgi:hypothetical protein